MTPYEIGVHLTAKNDISAVLTAIAGHMVGLNRSTEKLAENFGKLKVAIGGAATAFVGTEVLKFADHTERAGEALVHAKTMLESSLPAATRMADMAKINAAAWKETGANMRTGIVGNIEAIHDLRNALGDTAHALALLPAYNVAKNILDSVADQASIGDAASSKNIINAVRAFEKMGLADPAHPELMQQAMQDYAKTTVGLRGRVTGGNLFTQTQTAGDAALGWSEEFKTKIFPALIALGGNRVGFGSYQLFSNLWSGGGGNLSSKMQAMGQEKWGLHTSADELTDAGGKFKGFKAGSVWEADKLRANPLDWANDYRQKLKSMGVDIENMQSVQLVIADIARNNKNMKSMLDELLLPSTNRQLNKEVGNIMNVPGDAAGIVNKNDPRAWRQALSKQWESLEDVFGEQLVKPFIDNILKPLTEMFKNMSQWGAANSGKLKIIAEGVVALGAALVTVGSVILLTSVFGPGGLVTAAVIALGGLAALHWDWLNKYIHDFSDGIRNLGTGALEKVVGWVKSFGDAISELWGKLQSLNPFHHTSFEGGGFGGGGGAGVIRTSLGRALGGGGSGVGGITYGDTGAAGGSGFNVRGFRNMNLGNIGYGPWARAHGATGSAGTDTGHGVAVFSSFAAGLNAAAALALSKYHAGRHTALALIAGAGGWTPGNRGAAANIARAMGLSAGDDLHLDDPAHMDSFLRGLGAQELGPRGAGEYFKHITPYRRHEKPAVIENTMYLDGEVVHRSVVKRIVKGMTHPTTAPYHDGRRSWTPPDSGLVGV
jgi:hypothetical protein